MSEQCVGSNEHIKCVLKETCKIMGTNEKAYLYSIINIHELSMSMFMLKYSVFLCKNKSDLSLFLENDCKEPYVRCWILH